MNTYATDAERRSVLSMHLMAGGPIAVADRHDTIGDHLWVYQNEEMLELNADAFAGDPLTHDPTSEASQIWTGRLSNGDTVVGLFNREATPRMRSLTFADIGINGEVITDVIVWKLENGPVIQWGWVPRNLERVHVDGVDVLHNRMHSDAHNSCLINSARHFIDPSSNLTADPRSVVSDMLITNIRSEGMNSCAMRLFALSSWRNVHSTNLWIEQWNELDAAGQASRFEALLSPSGERVAIGNEVSEGLGVALFNFRVGEERITKAAENWRHDQLGRLDFDAALWENWNAK